ncbi:SDR family NAD(P)-dependent oxidoreductase [Jiangella asiatica]|nr:SDR family oxidoreductase [Jiangella asiatica]
MTDLEGLRFVITGAARGIGAATARLAARRGASVMVSDVDDGDGLRTVEAIRAAGGTAAYEHCDVSDPAQLQGLMEATADTFGGIDVLYNNAGITEHAFTSDTSLETMSVETFDRVYAINLRGPLLATKYALPHLRRSDRASVINCGSTRSFLGYPDNLAYGSTKGGVALLTKNLAVDLAPYGIRVNCCCPGGTMTTSMRNRLEHADDREELEWDLRSRSLLGRVGEAPEIAEVVCFLASDAASFVNGVVWLVDGGALSWRDTIDILGMR